MQRACKGRLKFLNHEFMRGKNVIVCASQPKYSYQNQLVEEMAKFRAQKVICNIVSSLKANSTLSRDLRDKPSTKKKLNLNTPKKKLWSVGHFCINPFKSSPSSAHSSAQRRWRGSCGSSITLMDEMYMALSKIDILAFFDEAAALWRVVWKVSTVYHDLK